MVVVGAGIAGLTVAHRLAAAGLPVTVLEAERGPGGRMATRAVGDGLMECGAQFLSTGYEIVPELLRDVGLSEAVVGVSGRTMAVAENRSWRFDTGRPWTLLSGGLLRIRDLVPAARGSWSTRALAARSTDDLGSWADLDGQCGLSWTRARFGPGVTERVTALTVHGLFFQELAGNSAALPAALTAYLARAVSAYTLRGGLGSLPTVLAERMDVEYGVRVERVERPDSRGDRVVLATSRGRRDADAVVLATPAGPTARMLADPTPDETAVLRTPYSRGLVAGLAVAEPLADDELGGAYGVLVRPGAHSPLAAVAVRSRADTTATGGEVLTVMFRQDAAKRLAGADDATVRAAAVDAVTPWLPGLAGRVVDSRVTRWDEAMPYVPVGHAAAVRRYRDRLSAGCRVLLAGDYLGFPWSDSAAFSGRWAADRLLAGRAH